MSTSGAAASSVWFRTKKARDQGGLDSGSKPSAPRFISRTEDIVTENRRVKTLTACEDLRCLPLVFPVSLSSAEIKDSCRHLSPRLGLEPLNKFVFSLSPQQCISVLLVFTRRIR